MPFTSFRLPNPMTAVRYQLSGELTAVQAAEVAAWRLEDGPQAYTPAPEVNLAAAGVTPFLERALADIPAPVLGERLAVLEGGEQMNTFTSADLTGPVDVSNGWFGLAQAGIGLLQTAFQDTGVGVVPRVSSTRVGVCRADRLRPVAVRGADGQVQTVWVCPPKRMDPLNPRAFRRAAVRVTRAMGALRTMEKVLTKAVRKSGALRGVARRRGGCFKCGKARGCSC